MKIENIIKDIGYILNQSDLIGLDWVPIIHGKKFQSLTSSKYAIFEKIKRSFFSRLFNLLGSRVLFVFEPFDRIATTKGIVLYLLAKIENNNFNAEDIKYLDEIKKRKIPNTNLYSFGYEYGIRGKKVTLSTPQAIVSYMVAKLFFELYLYFNEKKYLYEFNYIVEEMIQVFPQFSYDDKICFAYTTNSNYHVHNASLHFTELLAIYSYYNNTNKYDNLIEKSLNYSLSDFQKTENYYYAGSETRNFSIDNYHTGYLLRSLYNVNKYWKKRLQNYNLENEIEKLKKFYFNNFFGKEYIYKYKNKVIESHSTAETLLIFSIFKNTFSEDQQIKIENIIVNNIKLLYRKEKGFINKYTTFLGVPIVSDKLFYSRWSTGWMYYALSFYRNKGLN